MLFYLEDQELEKIKDRSIYPHAWEVWQVPKLLISLAHILAKTETFRPVYIARLTTGWVLTANNYIVFADFEIRNQDFGVGPDGPTVRLTKQLLTKQEIIGAQIQSARQDVPVVELPDEDIWTPQ